LKNRRGNLLTITLFTSVFNQSPSPHACLVFRGSLRPRRGTAAHDPSSVVQDLLKSLQGSRNNPSQELENLFTTLTDLLPPSSTLPLVDSANEKTVDHLLSFLSPSLLLLTQGHDEVATDSNFGMTQAVMQSLTLAQKKDILRRVLRSPQFAQSLGSLTVALRDGGLPSISEALQIPVDNGGFMRRGQVPLGGGDAVEAFLEGIKRHVGEKMWRKEDRMETD
jgi:26S proteasome regulatory subunit N13